MIELIVAIVGLCLVLLYIANTINAEEHALLKIFFIIIIVILCVLIGKSALDSENKCVQVVANETLVGNTTSYEYSTFCYTQTTTSTANIFYKGILFIVGIFLAYVVFYFAYVVFKWAERLVKRK